MKTVEQRFKEFVQVVFPHITKGEEMRAIQQVYYCAWLDCMLTLRDEIGHKDLPEDQSVEELSKLLEETKTWLDQDIDLLFKEKGMRRPTHGSRYHN